MEKINGNDNRQLIEATRERLRWYTLEASEEEFDAEEVDILVKILNKLEPVETEEVQSDEEVLERFHAYVEQREAEESVAVVGASKKHKKSRLAVFVRTHKFIAAAAAILIVIVVAGGSFGAVNASKGNGFFYWLKKDEEGMTMITSPENLDNGTSIDGAVEYTRIEDVPEEYRRYLVDLGGIEQLEEYELKSIWITQVSEYNGVKRCFEDSSGAKRLYVGAFIYPEKISLSRESYLSKELDIEGSQEEKILIKEKTEGDNEYTVYFYKDNVRYYVEGNIDVTELTEIATGYRNIVCE